MWKLKYLFGSVLAVLLFMNSVFADSLVVPVRSQLNETADSRLTRPIDHGAANGYPAICGKRPSQPVGMLTFVAATRPNPSVAKARVEAMGDAAIKVLRRRDIGDRARKREFRRLLRKNFEINAIGILTLGRHRASATPRQLEEFDALFSEFVLTRVSNLLDDYTNETFRVSDVVDAGGKGVAVRSRIVSERGKAAEVYWIMREFNGKPLIIDVRVDNISLVITQRDEFNSVIQREGMEGLLHRLRDQVGHRSAEGRR